MKITFRSKARSGIALIIVMIAIFVLASMAAIFAYSMQVESRLAMRANDSSQLLWLGRSGVELARWVLAQEATIPGQPYDALNEFWAGGPGGLSETNSVLSGVSLDHYQIGKGWVSIKIIDLERYANINTAGPDELQKALTLMGVDADEISIVSDSILDWRSPGDLPRIAGAKSDYYQGLNPPYFCKDAPIDSMSELLLIRGIRNHPEIFWGGVATNHPGALFQHKLGFGTSPGEVPDYPFGLKDLFTPFSTGQINVNTADANVLQLLPGVDATIAANIIQTRAGPDGVDGTADDTPFFNVSQLSAAGVPPAAIALCTVRSSTFRVRVTAHLPGVPPAYYTAILFRNGPDIKIVSFYLSQ